MPTSTDGGPTAEHEAELSRTPQLSDGGGATDAVRTQILSSEHYSLLATRAWTWSEIFSRATMFITVLLHSTGGGEL